MNNRHWRASRSSIPPAPTSRTTAAFDTVALKATALEALRNCDVILFVLDYTSFKDSINSELLQDLLSQRQEFLARNRGAIYFILNKVDCRTEGDRPLAEVIADLKQLLQHFGISQPQIYPVSAWQGLLAKLIASQTASDVQLKNFKQFLAVATPTRPLTVTWFLPHPRRLRRKLCSTVPSRPWRRS
ncbi:MAG: hypothetical protein HC838_17925 [Spirulinaceae cyanobacterium RM2_2_10]|nr:hypothetical protein [Spirulinaceae cyanobacterium RM2_2_10]